MNTIAFDISSALLLEGNQKSLKPDKNGVYHDIPLMVLGKVSRNLKDYEVTSMVDALTNPYSPFVRRLKAGQLTGEWGHPMIWEDKDLPRVMLIDSKNESHTIHRVCSATLLSLHTRPNTCKHWHHRWRSGRTHHR